MKYLLLMGSLLLLCISVSAQTTLQRTYRTQAVHQKKIEASLDYRMNLRKMERQIDDFSIIGQSEPITIPIVFHIVFDQAIENISEEQIYSQIAALNRDFEHEQVKARLFRRVDSLANFARTRPSNIGINFCLADLNGTSGIRLVKTTTPIFGEDDAIPLLPDAQAITPSSYLNIWIASLADSVSGYSQLPGGDAATDGIVIDYRFFGTMGTATAPYNNGSTLTHLVGSYLGLYELWNESKPCGDDGVWDTPIHNAPNYGRITEYKHVSLCENHPVEMTVNFMDHTLGAYMFTKGQKHRMRAVLSENGMRSGLRSGQSLCHAPSTLQEEISAVSRNTNEPLSLEEGWSFTIQPNPVKQQLQLQISKAATHILIYSLSGKLVYQTENQQTLELDCSNWTAGLYFIQVWNQQERLTQSFVVNR